MSLILDALNRADQDRKNKNLVPDLQSLHQSAEHNPAAASHKKILWLLLLLIGLLVLGILLILWVRPGPETPPLTPVSAAVNAVAIPVAPSTTHTVSSVAAAPPAVAVAKETAAPQSAQVNHLYAESVTAAQANPASEQVDQLYAAEEPSSPSESVVVPLAEVAAATNRRLVTDPVIAVPAAAVSARNFASVEDVIAFGDLPWNAKQQIPTISYSRHNYLLNNVSSVVINGQTAGEGNLVADHFVVEEILVDGVVLRVGDKRFKLKALNGWVNM
jgi:general secretion pathway protein B